ncbi:hypothetical protein [Streptosporangium subroseum]|uniref:hypothetical protein n=1 Tax=Streptosporangium subroseum TaxID=106412 RepID=UPI0030936796|nr:hypothetical protein OHB15_28880 [Streptosporangium subroseum]
MTSGQTAAESRIEGHEDDEVTDATAERHDKALAAVQRLLSVRGVRSCVVHRVNLKLFGDGRPYPLGQRRRLAPELAVTGPRGWHDATVSMGPRSGCYLVSLSSGSSPETVREPQQAADLILSSWPGARA